MIKRAIYLGLAAASAWQLYRYANRYLETRAKGGEQKEALTAWENEGGHPAPTPARAPYEQRQ